VLNADDAHVLAMRSRTSARVVTFGESDAADVRATDVELDDLGRPSFSIATRTETVGVALRLVGAHHVSNALARAAVALACGLWRSGFALAHGGHGAGRRSARHQ
jgi:UDP-N-acetylmuramoyl-tripeptide--D-alanyl-D-alanine ligase